MTGRDLIIYILQNGLEDEPIVKDGKFIGFLTVAEAAQKLNVGSTTILTLIHLGKLEGVEIGHTIYIPARELEQT